MSTPNVIVYPQTNNVVISKGTSEENIVSTYAVNVTSFPAVNVVAVNNSAGISTIAPNFPPESSSANGNAGEIRFDTNYLYICVSTNLWKKIALVNL